MASAEIRESSSIVQASDSATTVDLTSAVQAGDTVIVWRGAATTTYAAIGAPTLSGVTFSEICTYSASGTRPHLRCWHGVLVAGGAQSITCGAVGTTVHQNAAVVLQGTATLAAGATSHAGQMGASEGVHEAPALTVTDAAYLRLSMVQSRGPNSTTDYATPASWTLVAEITGTSACIIAQRDSFATAQDFTQGGSTWDEFAANSSAWTAPAGGVTVTPTAVGVVASVPAVTVATGSTVVPTAVVAVAAVPSATVATGSAATVSAAGCVATIPAPTASTGSTVTATAVAAVAAVPTPTVDVSNSATATPAVAASVAAMPSVTVSTGSTVTGVAVSCSAAVPTPSVQAGETGGSGSRLTATTPGRLSTTTPVRRCTSTPRGRT